MSYLADCKEFEGADDDTTRYMAAFLTTLCRRALQTRGDNDEYLSRLTKIVELMEREKRRDHLYAYGLYELAAEQISSAAVSYNFSKIESILMTYN